MAAAWKLKEQFTFRDQKIAYDVLGSGPPLVLIHGTPFSSYVWKDIARRLSRHNKIYLYDLLGYGQSEMRDGEDVSLGVQNLVLAAMLHHWQLEKPNVIAHDFGGATALRAALLNNCAFAKLLLIDPVAVRPWGSPFVQHVRIHEKAFAGVPDDIHLAILKAYLRGALHRIIGDRELEPLAAPWTGATGKAAFYRQIAQMDVKYTDEVQGGYSTLDCPVKLLWGAEDRWIPPERGRELAKLIPGCRLSIVPKAGHLMQFDAPEVIVRQARDFFAEG